MNAYEILEQLKILLAQFETKAAVDARVDKCADFTRTAIEFLYQYAYSADLEQLYPDNMQPFEILNIGDDGEWVCIKRWEFGTGIGKNIGSTGQLVSQMRFQDNFGQISNGTVNYGCVTVAATRETAIPSVLPLPAQYDGWQPVEGEHYGPEYLYREYTPDSIICHVRSLNGPDGTIGPMQPDSPSRYTGGQGGFTARWTLPAGGKDLGYDIVWETRCRFVPKPGDPSTFGPGYWMALWTCGGIWDGGPEMDLVESYWDTLESGLRDGNAFHVNSVGGEDERFGGAESWWTGMTASGMPNVTDYGDQQLTNWHNFTWVYRADDTYQAFIDGYLFQQGSLIWRYRGEESGEPTNMWFLFDFSALHIGIWPINECQIDPADLPMSYEMQWSRVWYRRPPLE